jgi:hypothetical protein
MFVETCELEERRKKAADENQQKTVSAAVVVNRFIETINLQEYPTLHSKKICLQTDKYIALVLRDIIKLSKKVKWVDLLKVLNYNDSTTSLVKVPCSVKQLGFKKQARRSRWVHRILQCVWRYKEEELVVDDEIEQDDDDDEFAFINDDAARWLITSLGDYYPTEFVKSAQALDMPIHQGKMDAVYTTAMWSDAGVGVAANYHEIFQLFFWLQVHCSPRADQPAGCRFSTTSCWYSPVHGLYRYTDLEQLLTGQIAKEHNNQPGFFYTSVDFVIGADHGQGSFRAGVRVIYRSDYGSIKATRRTQLSFWRWHSHLT